MVNKKRKIYNVILTILIISAIVVGVMIFFKYYNNYLNEKNIENKIAQIEEKFENISNEESIQETYEGYKIEGIIEIPEIKIKYPIINETNDKTMRISVTKFWGPNINEVGNYIIAGHNNLDGTMFGKTKYLKIGDIIKITDLKNKTIDYKIFKTYSVDPNDVSILDNMDKSKKEITLITCTNGRKQRLITKAMEI